MKNRITEIDALRGLALFGILVVNIFVFHAPFTHYAEFYGSFEGFELSVVENMIDFFAGKFMFIFAFLFGFGAYLQLQNFKSRFNAFYVRRMLVLLGFGLIHLFCFWFGDILTSYAILGLMLLPFLRLRAGILLGLGIFFLAFRPLYYFGAIAFDWPLAVTQEDAYISEYLEVYQFGNYTDIFVMRLREIKAFLPENLVWYVSKTFGLFFLGAYAAKIDFVGRLRASKTSIFVLPITLIAVSNAWNIFRMDLFAAIDLSQTPLLRPVLIFINVLFESLQGFGYIFLFLLMFQKLPSLSGAFAKTGRMALTNYILQSTLCILLFYGYGLGYYGRLNPSHLILIAIVIYIVNMLLSQVILSNYKQGPLEYLWRRLARRNQASSTKTE